MRCGKIHAMNILFDSILVCLVLIFSYFFYYSWALSHPVNRILKYWSRERRVYKRGIKEEGWNFVLRHLNTSVLKWSRGSKQEKKAFFESYSDLLSFKWTTVVLFTSLPPSSPSLLSAFSSLYIFHATRKDGINTGKRKESCKCFNQIFCLFYREEKNDKH